MARLLSVLLIVALIGAFTSEEPTTIFLAGDSTMAEKRDDRRPETGWGEAFADLFAGSSFRVANHARNGRSTRSFIEEGRWQALVDELGPGDYVLIQFGHNDSSENKPDRYTEPDEYRANVIRFVEEVRGHNARPVLLTPVVRRRFDEQGQFYDSHGEYPDIVRAVAEEHDVPLIDLERQTRRLLLAKGEAESKALFLHLAPGEHPNYPEGLEDDTHFSPLGARLVAESAYAAFMELTAAAAN